MKGETRRELLWLGLILLVGLCARLIFLSAWADTPLWAAGFGDEANFHASALSLLSMGADLQGFLYQPLYSFYLAGVYGLFGVDPGTVRNLQMLLGMVSILLAYGLGRELGGRVAGRLSGLGAALYGPLIFFEGQLLAPGLVTPLLLGSIWLLLRAGKARRFWLLLPAGTLLGLAVMGRPNLLLLVPAAGLWWLVVAGGWRVRLLGTGMALVGLGLGLAPSWIHNARQGMSFTPVSTAGGISFFIGNNPQASGRFHVPRGLGIDATSHQAYRATLTAVAERGRGRTLSAPEVSAYWYGRGLNYWRDQPGSALGLIGKKFLLAVNSQEMPIHNPYFVAEHLAPVLAWLFRFSLVFSFAGLGFLLAWKRRTGLGLLALCAGTYLASMLAFYVADRYRLALAVMLLPVAALGVVELSRAFRQRPWRRLWPVLLVLAAAFAFTQLPMLDARARQRALVSTYNRMGKTEGERGHLEQAARWFQRALDEAGLGQGSLAMSNLGLVAEKRGKLGEAEDWYRQAAERDPENRFARRKLATLCLRRGDLAQALLWLRQLEQMEADPGEVREAIERLERQLSINPTE